MSSVDGGTAVDSWEDTTDLHAFLAGLNRGNVACHAATDNDEILLFCQYILA